MGDATCNYDWQDCLYLVQIKPWNIYWLFTRLKSRILSNPDTWNRLTSDLFTLTIKFPWVNTNDNSEVTCSYYNLHLVFFTHWFPYKVLFFKNSLLHITVYINIHLRIHHYIIYLSTSQILHIFIIIQITVYECIKFLYIHPL